MQGMQNHIEEAIRLLEEIRAEYNAAYKTALKNKYPKGAVERVKMLEKKALIATEASKYLLQSLID